jgi:hypothetical protein
MMYRTWTFLIASSLFVALVAIFGVIDLQAQSPTDQAGSIAPAAAATSQINFQGVLQENGQNVSGSRAVGFTLYADSTCTTPVGTTYTETVTVDNGLFNVNIPVDQSNFNGQALWMQASVDDQPFGCQEITPAPYALNLLPGAEIDSDRATSIFRAINRNTEERTRALYGKVYSTVNDTAAIYGHSAGETGETYGVYGKSDTAADGAAGVYGTSTYTGTTGKVYGLYGYVDAPNGRALQAVNDATTGQARAVYAKNYSTDGGQALYAHAGGTSGENYGVYGKSDSPDGYAGYFDNTAGGTAGYFAGDVEVKGNITVVTDDPNTPGSELEYSAVTSDNPVAVYTGNATLAGTGTVTVTLPAEVSDLYTTFTYQVTPLGAATTIPYISTQFVSATDQFEITGDANLEVSWTVYAQ